MRGPGDPARVAALVAVLLVGCGHVECRKEEPLAEVERGLHDELDDRLDDWDASAGQRKRVHELGAELMRPVAALRARTTPMIYELTALLRTPDPDRTLLGKRAGELVDAFADYFHGQVPTLMAGHALLTPEQRKLAGRPYREPTDVFEGSWLLDRAIDYLLAEVDADERQRAQAWKIRDELIRELKIYTRQMDGVRLAFASELARPNADPAQFHRLVDRGASHSRKLVFSVIGYYVYFAHELGSARRAPLDRQLVRLEPCRTIPATASTRPPL